MNRPLRFRAWFPVKPKWWPRQMILSDEEHGLGDWFNEVQYENAIITQFTGLTCHGIDIYEGDIFNTKAARWEVVFEEGAFKGKWLMGCVGDENTRQILAPMMEHAIPLGNRYDNPELLVSVMDSLK